MVLQINIKHCVIFKRHNERRKIFRRKCKEEKNIYIYKYILYVQILCLYVYIYMYITKKFSPAFFLFFPLFSIVFSLILSPN